MPLTEAEADSQWPAPTRAWAAAAILTVGNALAFVDRNVPALLVEPIKADLGISDTRISLLTGLPFTLFYVLMGLAVAHFADRGIRRNVIAGCILLWSATTAACGLSWNYLSLLMARVGTGAGQGGFSPSANSLLADYFPRERLPAALGLYASGIYVGNGLGILLGSAVIAATAAVTHLELPLVGSLRPWQMVFVVAAAPGLLLSVLMLAIREPHRRELVSRAASVSSRTLSAQFRAHRTAYLALFAGTTLFVMNGAATAAWIPALFARQFHWDTAQLGTAYGAVVLLCGTSGALAGGWYTTRLRRAKIADANGRAAQLGITALLPFALCFALVPNPVLSLALIAGMNFFAGFPFASAYSAVQEMTPNRLRARMAALFVLCINLIGAGCGPTLVALFTDWVFADPLALRYSLAITTLLTLPLALLCMMICRKCQSREAWNAPRAPWN